MTTIDPLLRAAFPGKPAPRSFTSMPQLATGVPTRAGLPVVSNRAFIRAWLAHRARIAAQRARIK